MQKKNGYEPFSGIHILFQIYTTNDDNCQWNGCVWKVQAKRWVNDSECLNWWMFRWLSFVIRIEEIAEKLDRRFEKIIYGVINNAT